MERQALASENRVDPAGPGPVRVGSRQDLEHEGRLLGKVGRIPVVVVVDGGGVYAIEDRCPHLGFPLHQGTFESGMVTCHWHHARFDLASGCTLDPWADDAAAFDVEMRGDDVLVTARPGHDPVERWERRLGDALEHDLVLVLAKAVPALLDATPDGVERVLRIVGRFGLSNRAAGWGSGLTVLTCMANLLDHLDVADRPLALVHAARFVTADTRGRAPRFALPPLAAAGQPPERLASWYRRFVETRSSDGAERSLATLLAGGHLQEAEAVMFAAATDHAFLDGGHTLDFTNKAIELIGLLPADASVIATSLVAQTCEASRAEESQEWNHPVDLVTLAASTVASVREASEPGAAAESFEDADVAALGWALLADDPAESLGSLPRAARAGASAEQLARAVAFAAALRQVRFHLNNDPTDWDTVHHTFTYANAVHRAVLRCPTADLVRGIVHGAVQVHLDRFLNVPAARLPAREVAAPAELGELFDRRGTVDDVAGVIAGSLRAGVPRAEVIAALGHALLREDAGFHWYQSVEAGVQQALAWPEGSEESALVLVGTARFLAAHTPTRRELATIARTATRLRRGEEVFVEGTG